MVFEPTPREIAEEFLNRLEDERRDTVDELVGDDAVITVPGARFEGPGATEAFLAHYDPRYDWAAKDFDRWIETDQAAISIGTLYGEDNDGEGFSGVRYVDVYEVDDGLIRRLDIWNDLIVDGVT
ncbi:nuclear transport factor 2 family protein [Natronomonas marina]|jgi:limonene-1,2-epoxide hydrolase|uniref:nuclear transport factor 2 family protein n=1 Tax=Natronomonas marina TaxID=2961939 RepID=UPI0020C9C588|nr:nuclear transport factor 2 family protein [Natronomonas marina]